MDLVNNVIYNPGVQAAIVKNGTRANFINNFIKAGPNSTLDAYIKDGGAKGPATGYYVGTGNVIDDNRTNKMELNTAANQVNTPYAAPAVTTTTAQIAYNQVLDTAGAYQGLDCSGNWVPRRDAVDTRVVQSVLDRTRGHTVTDTFNGYIKSPDQVGGWPTLAAGTACADGDNDGMPDQWEGRYTLPSNQASNNVDTDGDGYTNLEEYLNGTNPKVDDTL